MRRVSISFNNFVIKYVIMFSTRTITNLFSYHNINRLISIQLRYYTIYALSSGSLPSAIAVIRISGEESLQCLQRLTKRQQFKPRYMFYSSLFDSNGTLIDRAMAVFLPGPSTFTGEDTVELYVHGSRAVVNCVCETLSSFENVQAAKAGEFTKRAFFNSKLTIDDVHSLSYLLSAETQRQRLLAIRSDPLGKAVRVIREALLELICSIEGGIDFADDVDFDWDSVNSRVTNIIQQLEATNRRVQRGTLITDGIRIAMIGKTNVGKSSLLNRIAERDVAIVSNIEGTTRDALEVRIELASVPVTFIDTAGIRPAGDCLEAEGISRTIARASEANLLLVVMDVSKSNDLISELHELLEYCQYDGSNAHSATNILVVCNKSDLSKPFKTNSSLPYQVVFTSCINATGIEQLLDLIKERINEMCWNEGDDAILSQYRQRTLLKDAICILQKVKSSGDAALVAEYLREASDLIGEISGAIVNEEILDRIFASFCIGK